VICPNLERSHYGDYIYIYGFGGFLYTNVYICLYVHFIYVCACINDLNIRKMIHIFFIYSCIVHIFIYMYIHISIYEYTYIFMFCTLI
jgi:hypothetical protein